MKTNECYEEMMVPSTAGEAPMEAPPRLAAEAEESSRFSVPPGQGTASDCLLRRLLGRLIEDGPVAACEVPEALGQAARDFGLAMLADPAECETGESGEAGQDGARVMLAALPRALDVLSKPRGRDAQEMLALLAWVERVGVVPRPGIWETYPLAAAQLCAAGVLQVSPHHLQVELTEFGEGRFRAWMDGQLSAADVKSLAAVATEEQCALSH